MVAAPRPRLTRSHHGSRRAWQPSRRRRADFRGVLEDPVAQRLSDALAGKQLVDEPIGLGRREWLEEHVHRIELAAAPRGPDVEQLGASHADHEDRRVAAEVGDVLDEVEEHGLSPVQIVEHDHERSLGRGRLKSCARPRRSPPGSSPTSADRGSAQEQRPSRDRVRARRGARREPGQAAP